MAIRDLLQTTFTAAAFAEAGEHDTAREILGTAPPTREPGRIAGWLGSVRRTFAAVAFAEADMPETAVAFAGGERASTASQPTLDEFMRQVGLTGVPAFYGTARI